MARKKKEVPAGKMGIHGFYRIQLKEDGEIVGDSGWKGPNMVTNVGIQNGIMNLIAKTTGSFQVGAMAVGTGTAPASNATSLDGEYGGSAIRVAVGTVATTQRTASDAMAILQFQCKFDSSLNTASCNVANIGLFDVSTAAGNMLCGNTFASSKWDTNQDLYASYELRFDF